MSRLLTPEDGKPGPGIPVPTIRQVSSSHWWPFCWCNNIYAAVLLQTRHVHSNSALYYLRFTCISHGVWNTCVCSCKGCVGVAGLPLSAFLGRPKTLHYTYSRHVQVAIPAHGARLLMGSNAFWKAIPFKQSVKNMRAKSAREVPTALQMVAIKGEAQLHPTVLVADLLPVGSSITQLDFHHMQEQQVRCSLLNLCVLFLANWTLSCQSFTKHLSPSRKYSPCLLWQCSVYTGSVHHQLGATGCNLVSTVLVQLAAFAARLMDI